TGTERKRVKVARRGAGGPADTNATGTERKRVKVARRGAGGPADTKMIHATTVLSVRHGDSSVMASDGQVTFGNTVVKHAAKKIRRLYNDRVLAGFAGSAADSFALFARFEAKLEQYRGNL